MLRFEILVTEGPVPLKTDYQQIKWNKVWQPHTASWFGPRSLPQIPTTPDVSKIKARNNIVQNGAEADALSLWVVATMTLIFSTAPYSTWAWVGNMYTECINTHLARGTKIVSGTLKLAPNVWLPIFIHHTISLLRKAAMVWKYKHVVIFCMHQDFQNL